MSADPTEQLLETLWQSRGLKVASLGVQADGTVATSDRRAFRSRRRERSDAGEPHAIDAVDELVLGELLGRGGMGVVNLATQRTLHREVAVKRALDPDASGEALLEEGWALAHLAHPNVVPVHALARLGGAPALVMKRITGTLFADVLARPEAHAALSGDDPLVSAIRTLIEVARAVEHAHRRGVVHLDLKPANVMIGDFGEVYVLDWGLSARIGDEPAHLPRAADIEGIAGTPEYMAPELALADGASIDARTDVYLLGAMLYEIVAHRPRHDGRNPIQRIYSACVSAPPTFPEGVPEALQRIIERATHKDRDARHPSAESFRHALEGYLRHREADALFSRAEREVQALEEALSATPREPSALHHHFGAARFALRESALLLPGRSGEAPLKARLHNAMARFALDEGELALAGSHLSESGAEDPVLAERLKEALRSDEERKRHQQRLEQLGRESDLETGRRIRGRVTFALALTFLASNLTMSALERWAGFTLGYADMVIAVLLVAAVVAPLAWMRRRQLFPNRAATGLWGITLSALAIVEGHWLLSYAIGLPFRDSLTLTPLYYTLCFGALATLLDARLWPAAILQAPVALLAALYPEWIYEILGGGGTLSVLYLALVWSHRSRVIGERA